MELSNPGRALLMAAVGALGAAALGACSSDDTGGQYDTVVIVQPGWTGGQANAAVAAHILEHELNVPVRLWQLKQPMAWDALADGSAHAVLEDWGGVPDKEELYVGKYGAVVAAGELGVVGHIGWFVPRHFAERNPEVLHWENLNDFAEDFRTPESGDRGRLLLGHPDDTTHDEALIDQLGLDYRAVPAGSEDALIEAVREADRQGTPLLTYWWQPHWLNAETDLVEVQLPPHTKGCQDDPEQVACGYPDIPLQKYLNAGFARDGGVAAEFLTKFRWTTEEQNEVARLIAAERMTPAGAAEQWVHENPDRLADWLPDGGGRG
ncbi:glycine betaine ABC transporter substrate-binding protein [Streptomyces sp. ACA25]|uniref:glycine betaine ABC transporter substrate-binding protein n=1 Tax=Streptomyces sp. ACA25 TaxID=3022596 RepID=UPI002306ECEC|nr:glycine betaine ABC transporter substrate-binding protein [Streptomyces sp. ACA25]MDB1087091.1 glycine betaine ABC transporter substrate-binding protein [Streptomyces sp. ACA25]